MKFSYHNYKKLTIQSSSISKVLLLWVDCVIKNIFWILQIIWVIYLTLNRGKFQPGKFLIQAESLIMITLLHSIAFSCLTGLRLPKEEKKIHLASENPRKRATQLIEKLVGRWNQISPLTNRSCKGLLLAESWPGNSQGLEPLRIKQHERDAIIQRWLSNPAWHQSHLKKYKEKANLIAKTDN